MIEVKNVVKNYTAGSTLVNALKGVSISFRESEFVSVLGQSGCGKTTLLNVLGGLDRYDSGDLLVNGKTTKKYKDRDWDTYRNHYVGFVFQTYNLIMHLSVLENVEIALTIAGLSKKEKRQRAITALSKVGLFDQLKKKPNQLSGGQMQRVAIARAIVNDPQIILADEPTGALDSETSLQIMEILKEISADRLVIMVTHNRELSERYSTRIVKLFDGEIVGDTNPLTDDEKNNIQNNKSLNENINKTQPKQKIKRKKKASMNYLTALNLSFKNLLTKKGRTIMTSFAGSIGIIGIALVIAVSNGFTGYINKIQSDTLSGYPINISTISVDLEAMSTMNTGRNTPSVQFPSEKEIIIKAPSSNSIAAVSHYNFISPGYINYIKDYESQDKLKPEAEQTLNTVSYSYAAPLNIITQKNTDVILADTKASVNILTGATSSAFYEGLPNSDFVMSQYDVLHGKYPTNENEIALVIGKSNELSREMLEKLGIPYTLDGLNYANINFNDIVNADGTNGKEYQVVLNDNYYNKITNGSEVDFEAVSSAALASLYNNPQNIKLKITAIMRVKPTSALSIFSSGIMYLPSLTNTVRQTEINSEIAVMQRQQTSKLFFDYNLGLNQIAFSDIGTMQYFFKTTYNIDLSSEQVIEYSLQQLSASSIPSSIKIYAKNFNGKDQLTTYLNNWQNTDEGKTNKIIFSDASQLLSSTMGQMVNIISYVLIAFAAISLVVSSIMISIITYVSVIERTKEIGVLRSIGARKKDITRVFNAETMIIGFIAGLLGVVVSFLLTIPISAIIIRVAGGTITSAMAVLDIKSAISLILISTLLTLIAGFIPSRMASKKDPVKALRSE